MTSALTQAKNLASFNNKLDRQNVKLQYTYNKALANQDRAFQERMSNSAHQREVKDLKKAGLNPVLSVAGGSGASTPSGSSASVSKPNVDTSIVGAVMDWATAQLNSATILQRTAMETANAYSIAQLQQANAYSIAELQQRGQNYRHRTPSGNSISGQIRNSPNTVRSLGRNTLGVLRSISNYNGLTFDLPGFIRNGYNKFVRRANRGNSSRKGGKSSNSRYNPARVTDIDKLITALRTDGDTSSAYIRNPSSGWNQSSKRKGKRGSSTRSKNWKRNRHHR